MLLLDRLQKDSKTVVPKWAIPVNHKEQPKAQFPTTEDSFWQFAELLDVPVGGFFWLCGGFKGVLAWGLVFCFPF